MRVLLVVAVALALRATAAAQESAAFLKLGAGGRALGMGGAQAGAADDVYAIAWNPAALSGLASRELGFMHGELAAGLRYDFIGYAHPSKAGIFAFAARRLDEGTLDGRDSEGRPTGGFSASDVAVDLAYGARLAERARAGATVRFIRSGIGEHSAQGFALDLGGQYSGGRAGPGVPRFGLAVLNLGPGLKYAEERSPLPLTVTGGVGYSLPAGVTLACDLHHRPYSRSSELKLGTEYALLGGFALRAGYSAASGAALGSGRLDGLAAGFGLRLRGYSLDYAAEPFGAFGNAHRFSVGARF